MLLLNIHFLDLCSKTSVFTTLSCANGILRKHKNLIKYYGQRGFFVEHHSKTKEMRYLTKTQTCQGPYMHAESTGGT